MSSVTRRTQTGIHKCYKTLVQSLKVNPFQPALAASLTLVGLPATRFDQICPADAVTQVREAYFDSQQEFQAKNQPNLLGTFNSTPKAENPLLLNFSFC